MTELVTFYPASDTAADRMCESTLVAGSLLDVLSHIQIARVHLDWSMKRESNELESAAMALNDAVRFIDRHLKRGESS